MKNKVRRVSEVNCYLVEDSLSEFKQIKYARQCLNKDVLELGAGKDTFRNMCLEKYGAKSVVSIDRYPHAESKNVIKADLIPYLKSTKKKFDVVYARHILEHFYEDDAVEIIKGAYRVLRSGGQFLIIVLNMKNIAVAMCDFWREFEHKRPYMIHGISINLRQHGFEVAEAGQAVDTWDMAWYKQVIRKMREIIVGIPYEAPDVYIRAVKP